MKAVLLRLILTLPFVCSTAYAHDYRIEREGNQYALYQGHLYSTHKGEPNVAYDPAIVKAAYCAAGNGALTELPRSNIYPLRLDGSCTALFVQSSSGYWSQTLTETVNKPRTEVRGALRGWLSEESIKYLADWAPGFAGPMTQRLELVPLENPLTLEPGDKIRMVALYQGKPQAGVVFAYDGEARGVTGDDGKLNVRVRHGGMQVVSASLEQPVQGDPNADKVLRGTIFQFPLKSGSN
ncbi:MAG: DUF4198 domain-containing protein [Gammaproteobacteria bacterium]